MIRNRGKKDYGGENFLSSLPSIHLNMGGGPGKKNRSSQIHRNQALRTPGWNQGVQGKKIETLFMYVQGGRVRAIYTSSWLNDTKRAENEK